MTSAIKRFPGPCLHRMPGAICLVLVASLAVLCPAVRSESVRLTILHTNDLHDHVRPGENGLGGLPYISGYVNVLLELTGAEVAAYVTALQGIQQEPPEWAGFRATWQAAEGGGHFETDLEAGRTYRVVMSTKEWEGRYLRLAERMRERDRQHPLAAREIEPTPLTVTFTDALHAYIKQVLAEGNTPQVTADQLVKERDIAPVNRE